MAKIIPFKDGTKKEVITIKASELFREKGFSATSMRDIAGAIGVEAPSLYNHITSKKEILQEICFKIAGLFTTNINRVALSRQPVLQKLEKIIRFHIHMMLEQYEYVYISDHEWKHLPEPYLAEFRNLRKIYRNRLAGLVEAGITTRELTSIDPHVTVLIILSAIGGIENWQRSRKSINAKLLEENMVAFLLSGLKNDQ